MTILEFLYNTVPGRFLLKPLTGPRLSRICGHFLDSELSSFLIQPFVKQNAIQLSDYETTDIKSFNDFFSRKIKQGKRPIDMEENHLIAQQKAGTALSWGILPCIPFVCKSLS